jgi:hypothetical protein
MMAVKVVDDKELHSSLWHERAEVRDLEAERQSTALSLRINDKTTKFDRKMCIGFVVEVAIPSCSSPEIMHPDDAPSVPATDR